MKISEVLTQVDYRDNSQTVIQKCNNNVIQRFGDARKFAETFNPDLQKNCAANIQRTLTGNAPSVNQLMQSYKDEQVRIWIMIQLEDLNTFAGTRNKMNPRQMTMVCDVIITEYYYLKASELLLFFFHFKSGKYGELYGSVDPLRITSALVEFASYRCAELFKIENKLREEKKEKEKLIQSRTAITRKQYVKNKFHRTRAIKKVGEKYIVTKKSK